MQTIRKLGVQDWTQVQEKIMNGRNFYIAQTKEEIGQLNFLEYTQKSFKNPEETIYGYFVNDELISITTVYDFKVVPAYLLKNFKHFLDDNLYNPVKNGMALLLNHIIDIQERKGLYTFYMAKTANPRRLNQERYRKQMFNIACPKLKNYMITVEEIVKAGEDSKYGLHKEGIYYKRKMQEDTCVIRYTCSQEFRLNADPQLSEKMIKK